MLKGKKNITLGSFPVKNRPKKPQNSLVVQLQISHCRKKWTAKKG